MKDFKIGKKLYRSTALAHFKVVFILIAVWVFINLYFKTFSDPDFITRGGLELKDVFEFHFAYPVQFIGFLFGTLIPALYYAFFRGIVFFEEGAVINRGLPFFNHCVKYSNVESFKVIHPKYLMSLKRKDVGEELLFTVRDIDRVIAILDQHNIKGDLGSSDLAKSITISKKVVIYSIIFGVVVSALQYSGIMIELNRYLFR
jgi:hypothetical protein